MMKTTSLFFIFALAVTSCFSAEQQYEECLVPLRCGQDSTNISYPFWGVNKPNYCGLKEFQLLCKNNQFLTLNLHNVSFRVMSFDTENQTITVAEESLFMGMCPDLSLNFTGSNQFTLSPLAAKKIDLFDCLSFDPSKVDSSSSFPCERSNNRLTRFYTVSPYSDCQKVGHIPVIGSAYGDFQQAKLTLEQLFKKGFRLSYKTIGNKRCGDCMSSGGICGFERASESFQCLCADKPHKSTCVDQNAGYINWRLKFFIGGAAGLTGILMAVALAVILRMRNTFSRREQNYIEALVPLKRYSYAQVKKITKSFTHVVGKGGFGTVYRGILCDGRIVAVKVLKESKGNEEDFINEVASMSKTSHVNIVTLLGFCYQGSKRAIIYEFLENGSLDKFISSKKSSSVDWNALYGIALGVARGLDYLHNGCGARIVHFDIKPQNVLLDENLCPKVSDFGLAKRCKNKESLFSLMDARGTIGYIAPEVFSRMYGRVSHKSDVYSYGMLVLEMIGARNKTSAEDSASNTSSMYFPEWIYKDLEKGDNKRLTEDGIRSEEEEIAKKMTLVGLWCIQSSPSDRPSMNRVVEMMEGSMDAIEVPPKPVLQFPLVHVPHTESSWISEENSSPSEALSLCHQNVNKICELA